jgi:hypothetical protein
VGLRLFLPETWTGDEARLERAGVPVEYRSTRTKSEIALAELNRLIAAGVRFGTVLADAGYGMCKYRFDFPQKRRSEIRQFGGRTISRWVDRRLRFWAAFRDVSVSAEWGWLEGWLCS